MEKRRMDMSLLDETIAMLAQGLPLPASNRDHELVGSYAGHRECHIQSDWLLVYRIDGDVLVLSLTRTGAHSDIF
jgi:mRNA interferase YafQ